MKISFQNIILPFVLAATILGGGCAVTSGLFGHNSSQVEKASNRITSTQNKIEENTDKKIFQAKDLTYGTGYALDKVTNNEPAIVVAKEMNDRVQNILGLPPLEQQKEMVSLVNGLISNNIIAKIKLSQMDKNIIAIQDEENVLVQTKDKQVKAALDLSTQVALQADASKQELSKYKGWFGLSAVFMGVKQFLTDGFWALLGFGVVFLVLRLLSATNPIAGAIFGIFDTMFSWAINCIKTIAPKAMSIANTVSSDVYNDTKGALKSIVDSVETVRLTSAASGKPATIEDLLNTAELSMNDSDKALIEQIKLEMGWIKNSTASTVPTTIIKN